MFNKIKKFIDKNYFLDINKFEFELEEILNKYNKKEQKIKICEKIYYYLRLKKHDLIDKKNNTEDEEYKIRLRKDIKIIKKKYNLVERKIKEINIFFKKKENLKYESKNNSAILKNKFEEFITFVIEKNGNLESLSENELLTQFICDIQNLEENNRFKIKLTKEQLEYLDNSEYESLRKIYRTILYKSLKYNVEINYINKEYERKIKEYLQEIKDTSLEKEIELIQEYKDLIIIEDPFNEFINYVIENNGNLESLNKNETYVAKKISKFMHNIQSLEKNNRFKIKLTKEQLEYLDNSKYESLRKIYRIILYKSLKHNVEINYINKEYERKIKEYLQEIKDTSLEKEIELIQEYKGLIVIEDPFNEFINYVIENNGNLESLNKNETYVAKRISKFMHNIQSLEKNNRFKIKLTKEQLEYLDNSEYESLRKIYKTILYKSLKHNVEISYINNELYTKLNKRIQKNKLLLNLDEKTKKDFGIFILPFSYDQIEALDKKFNINTLEIINEINNANNKNLKIKEAIELYTSILEKIDENSKYEIRTIAYLLEKLLLYASKNKIVLEERKEKNEELYEDDKKILLNEIQQSILNLMQNNEDLDEYEIKDVIIAYSYYILNNDILENKDIIERYSKYINELLVEYLYDEGQNFEEFIIMINILKHKVDHTEKETEERIILKNILKQFKDLYNIYKDEKKTKDNDSYFKIIDFWLQDEKNYLYIKELLKRKKFVYNLKVNDKHIVFYILDLYIKNYKIMLNDKNGTYINPVYLEEVYYLFTRNYALRMTSEEKEEIDEKLKDLRNYIADTLIKQKRKNHAINKAKEMSSKNFYRRYQYEEYEEFDEEQLSNMGAHVAGLVRNQVKEKESKDAFILGNDAYSIEEKNGLIHMIVYSINYHNFIAKDSFIDRYLHECELKHEKVDEYFKSRMNFKVGSKYPVFAYELIFYPGGKFKELKVSKDVINITDKYVYTQSTDETKAIGDLYQKSVSKNGGFYSSFDTSRLNEHFKNILEKSFVEFLQTERLPFIYYGYSKTLEEEKEYNLNNLSNILYELDKSSSKEIIEVFSDDVDKYHYSNLPIPNAEYDLNVLNPVSFLGLEMQRMLDDCYFNQRLYSNKERIHKLKLIYLDKYIKLVEELNKKIDYIDPNVIKMSRGRIKNKIRL